MTKEGKRFKSWKDRYCALLNSGTFLYYDKEISDHDVLSERVKPQNRFVATKASRNPSMTNGIILETSEKRKLKFFTSSAKEQTKWIRAVESLHEYQQEVEEQTKLTPSIAGWLRKEGQNYKTWKRRFFKLTGQILSYSETVSSNPIGRLHVKSVQYSQQQDNCLEIRGADDRVLRIMTEKNASIDDWYSALQDAIHHSSSDTSWENNPPVSSSRSEDTESIWSDRATPTENSNQQHYPLGPSSTPSSNQSTPFARGNNDSQDDFQENNADASWESSQDWLLRSNSSPGGTVHSGEQEELMIPLPNQRRRTTVSNKAEAESCEGYIEKLGQRFKSWKRRYFVLHKGYLKYYREAGGEQKGEGKVLQVRRDEAHPFTLSVQLNGVRWLTLRFESENDLARWETSFRFSAEKNQRENSSSPDDLNDSYVMPSKDVSFSGWFQKKGQTFKTWKRRYFVLRENVLTYYSDYNCTELLGNGRIHDVSISDVRPFSLEVCFQSGRRLQIAGESQAEIDRFYKAIEDVLEQDKLGSFKAQTSVQEIFQEDLDSNKDEIDDTNDDIDDDNSFMEDAPRSSWAEAEQITDESMKLRRDSLSDLSSSSESDTEKTTSPAPVSASSYEDNLMENDSIFYAGWLRKEGENVKNWKRRYFTLRNDTLCYYKHADGDCIRRSRVIGCQVNATIPFSLEIILDDGRHLYVCADSKSDIDKWQRHLEAALSLREQRNRRASEASSALNQPPKKVTGWLGKETQKLHQVKRRYFVLSGSVMQYFVNQDDPFPKRTLRITGVRLSHDKEPVLEVDDADGHTIRLHADSRRELDKWYNAINDGQVYSGQQLNAPGESNDEATGLGPRNQRYTPEYVHKNSEDLAFDSANFSFNYNPEDSFNDGIRSYRGNLTLKIGHNDTSLSDTFNNESIGPERNPDYCSGEARAQNPGRFAPERKLDPKENKQILPAKCASCCTIM